MRTGNTTGGAMRRWKGSGFDVRWLLASFAIAALFLRQAFQSGAPRNDGGEA